ncbi:hypothetical protein I4U23_030331 [Adineta vaga]|nr:hypothetical protein I4U23_030331 [Adineta vaga]
MDSFVQCYYCNKLLNHPLELLCRHSFCSNCLTKEVKNEKIICPICSVEHTAPGASLSTAKEDKLTPYLIGLNSGDPYSSITETSPATIHAECAGCKQITDLRICFHCDKPLCTSCRAIHYELQRKDVDHSIQSLLTKTNELLVIAQSLNTSRTNRIQEYKLMKDKVTAHANELVKILHDEEQTLQKKIDARIQYETERIATTEREQQYLQKNKTTLDQVVDKYRDEKNQMILLKMHKDYLDLAPNWRGRLDIYAGRINTKKEEELHFQPTQPGKNDTLVGKLIDSKNVTLHAVAGSKPVTTPAASRSCNIM